MGDIFYFKWEADFLTWLQHLGEGTPPGGMLLALNHFFSLFGEEVISILVFGCIYWGFNKQKAHRIGAAILMATVTNGMIKNLFCRLRPYLVLERVSLLRKVDGFSFPSGHSATAASLYPSVSYEFKRVKWLRYIAVLLPLLVAISRNYLGAHWPTDVIFGLLQGSLILLLVEIAYAKLRSEKLIHCIMLLIGLTGIFYCKTDDYYSSLGLLLGFILGTAFEERFVQFENTRKLSRVILRTLVGGLLFALLNPVVKLCIGHLFEAGTPGDYFCRVLRYGFCTFILTGVYPYVFRLEERIFSKREDTSAPASR